MLFTPGEMLPYDAFLVSCTSVFSRFHLTGKLKVVPLAIGPFGRLARLTSKWRSPTVTLLICVMAMLALQEISRVAEEPRATEPKDTGDVQLRGRLTGEPRQYSVPVASET